MRRNAGPKKSGEATARILAIRPARDPREESREAAIAAAIARQVEQVERTFPDRWEW